MHTLVTRKPQSFKKGFTLIELLVVIAIIAILAAILFPMFAEARNRARLTACISNVRQIAMAVHVYASEHNDQFPVGISIMNDLPDNHCVFGKEGFIIGEHYYGHTIGEITPAELRPLNEYLRSIELVKCPRERVQRPPIGDGIHTEFDIRGTSYVFNGVLGIPNNWPHHRALFYRKMGDIRYPAQQVMLGERGIHDFWGYGGFPADWPGWGYRNHCTDSPRSVIAFVDGHASYVRFEKGKWEGQLSGRPVSEARWILLQPDWGYN